VKLVQCGWRPVIMALDWLVIELHFADVHHVGGHSVRYIKGTDWDVSELAKEGADAPQPQAGA
jgi:hypothetical protein